MIEYKVIRGSKTHITTFPVWDIALFGASFGLVVSAVLWKVVRDGR